MIACGIPLTEPIMTSNENAKEFNDVSSGTKKRRTLEVNYFEASIKHWSAFSASAEYARHKRKAEMNIRTEEDGSLSLLTHDGTITIGTRKDEERGGNCVIVDSLLDGSSFSTPNHEQLRRKMVEEYLSYIFARKHMDRDAITRMLMDASYQKGLRVGAINERKGFNKPPVWTRII